MSTEPDRTLSRLYTALGDEAQRTPLASPELLRRRGDRQGRARATLMAAAVVVLAAGAVAGGSQLLGGGDSKIVPAPPAPSTTLVPTPGLTSTPSPSQTPPTGATSRPAVPPSATGGPSLPARPTSIPDSVFQPTDNDDVTGRFLPSLCRTTLGSAGADLRRSRPGLAFPPDTTTGDLPDASMVQTVMLYPSAADAAWFLEQVRRAVRDCPGEPIETGTITYRVMPRGLGLGDEDVLVEQQIPASDDVTGEPVPGTWTLYTSVVRHGDSVAVVYTHPYENWGMEGTDTIAAVAADITQRMIQWRGPLTGGSTG